MISIVLLISAIGFGMNSCQKADAIEEAHTLSKQAFVDECMAEFTGSAFNKNEQIDACVCNHDYLYLKYGDTAYNQSTKQEFEDSVEKLRCFITIYKRKMRIAEGAVGTSES